jgi:hypothetical protein
MNRIISLVLALCLVLCLAACSDKTTPSETTTTPKTEVPATTTVPTTVPTTEAPTTAVPTTQIPATEAPVATISTTEVSVTEPRPSDERPTQPDEIASVRGVVDGTSYINEYFGLQIDAPTGWMFYTAEQIAQVNNMAADMLEGSDIGDLIAQNGQMTDMMMFNLAGSSVNLVIQPSQALLVAYSDSEIFSLLENTFETQMTAAGMHVDAYEVIQVKLGGEDKDVLHMSVSYSGVNIQQYQAWFRDSNYIAVLTASIADDTDPQEFFNCITLN